jgi:hypothetical protein
MKNKKNKHIYKVLSCLIILWVGIFYVREHKASTSRKNSQTHKNKQPKEKVKSITANSIVKDNSDRKQRKPLSRIPASAKKPSSPTAIPLVKRKIIGSKVFKLTNKISQDWKKRATKNLSKVWKSSHKNALDIKSLKSAIFVKNGIGKNVEHVLVSVTNDKGLPASFEAYIDSENGKIVQSWNKTRYEYRDDFKINPQGLEFKGLTLKKQ